MTKQPLSRFVLAVLLWLPVTFSIWYLSATLHLAPLTWIVGQLYSMWMPDALLWLNLQGNTLLIASNFGQDAFGNIVSPSINQDLLGFEVNPLIYTYGLPLLFSLILATPSQHKLWYLLWGGLISLLFQLFSMTMSVLKTLTFDVGLAFQQQQNMSTFDINLVALLYQMSILILPMVAPLIIWMFLAREFLFYLAPQLKRSL